MINNTQANERKKKKRKTNKKKVMLSMKPNRSPYIS